MTATDQPIEVGIETNEKIGAVELKGDGGGGEGESAGAATVTVAVEVVPEECKLLGVMVKTCVPAADADHSNDVTAFMLGASVESKTLAGEPPSTDTVTS